MGQERHDPEKVRPAEAGGMLRRVLGSRVLLWVVDLLLFGAFMAQVSSFVYAGAEDAYISFRVARNFARGVGFVYTPGEYVESVSNPLWTLCLSIMYWLGADMRWAGLALVLACATFFFLVLRAAGRGFFGKDTWLARYPLFATVCATHLFAGFGNMLEGSAAALGIATVGAFAISRNSLGMAVSMIFLMLLRPEAPLYAMAAGVWIIFETWRRRFSWLDMWRYMALTASALLGLVLLRAWYFGDIVPNTVRAKVPLFDGKSGAIHLAGMELLVDYLIYLGPVLLGLAMVGALFSRLRPQLILFSILAVSNALTVLQPGDWMMFRLLTPFLPLIALSAAAGMEECRRRGRFLGTLSAAAGIAGTIWLIQPDFLSERLPGWSEGFKGFSHPRGERISPCGLAETNPLLPHISNLDFCWPDDRVIVECGGGPGWVLDGVTLTEMWGLADRELVRSVPQMQRWIVGGIRNWPVIAAKNPTCYLLADYAANTTELLQTPGLEHALDNYVVFRPNPEAKCYTLILRTDRAAVRMAMLDYGSFFPPRDYLTCGVTPKNDTPTSWQTSGWLGEDGVNLDESWRDWGGTMRFGAVIPDESAVSYRRPLLDDSPVVLFAGIPAESGVSGVLRAVIRSSAGVAVEERAELGGGTGEFALLAMVLDAPGASAGDLLEIFPPRDHPGAVWVSAHRWPRGTPIPLPTVFVRERLRQAVRYFEDKGESQNAREALALLEPLADDATTPEYADAKRRALFHEAQPLRDHARAYPNVPGTRDALRAYYRNASAPKENLLEWAAMTQWFPEMPEMWNELALAALECGDMERLKDATGHCWRLTLYDSSLRAGLAETLEQAVRGALEKGDTAFATLVSEVLCAGDTPWSVARIPLRIRVAVARGDFSSVREALDAFDVVVRWYPEEYIPGERALSAEQTGTVLAQPLAERLAQGYVGETADLCGRLVRLGVNDLQVLDIWSAALLADGRNDEGLDVCRRLTVAYAEHYPGFDRLSNYYVLRGDLGGLVAEWRAYTGTHPDAHLGWFCLGLAHERRHEYAEAKAAYGRALGIAPDAQGTKDALARIEAIPAV